VLVSHPTCVFLFPEYSSQGKRKKEDDPSEESEAEDVLSMASGSSSSDEESSSSDDDGRRRKSPTKRASPAKRARASPTPDKKASPKKARLPTRKGAPSRKSVQTALTALSKKVLAAEETPETSLVAALLQSHTTQGKTHVARLQPLVRTVVGDDQRLPTLFSLVFRSVGGTGVLHLEDVDLEDMGEQELGDLLTKVVEEMEDTPADHVLLPCEPPTTVALREYRTLYEQFWYLVGLAAVDRTDAPSDDDKKEDDDDDASQSPPQTAREILTRLTDLVTVGVVDIRAAASMAVYHMGAALLDRTVELTTKLDHAERQAKAAIRSKQTRKAAALKEQIHAWKETIADLEDMVEKIVVGVFLKRYKDVHPQIRAYSVTMLSRYMLIRPDIYLQSSFLKYVGWLMSDKDAVVRESAVIGLLAPLRAKKDKNIDTSSMTHAIDKFLDRICDCVIDVDARVQGVAMELCLTLLREGFLDSVEDDEKWAQINLRALTPEATPSVRYNALLFVLEQLEPFDPSAANSEYTAVQRINCLVNWYATRSFFLHATCNMVYWK
jgi:cohesin complex subunit SA-1/2